MTQKEAEALIKDIPLGSKIRLAKTNGDTIEVQLSSNKVDGTPKIDNGGTVVPALPPAITVNGGSRFGNFRIDVDAIDAIEVL
ncbi:hypothetical protein [Ekhidna sp.]|uniref:hypothetical protein n=1 Tax=Ekhidna sp. TaxID=2608089 RepID=UPI003CCBDECE